MANQGPFPKRPAHWVYLRHWVRDQVIAELAAEHCRHLSNGLQAAKPRQYQASRQRDLRPDRDHKRGKGVTRSPCPNTFEDALCQLLDKQQALVSSFFDFFPVSAVSALPASCLGQHCAITFAEPIER